MAFTYNDINLIYNDSLTSYNGGIPTLKIGVFDNIQVSDTSTVVNPLLNGTAFDTIQIIENVNVESATEIDVSDLIEISEDVLLNNELTDISVFDNIQISENFSSINLNLIDTFEQEQLIQILI